MEFKQKPFLRERSGIYFRFAGLSVEEMFATKDPGDRAALRESYGRLQQGLNDCIYPHNEMVTRLVNDHSKNPDAFDWTTVDVRAREYERGIQQRDLAADEKLSIDQREAQSQAQKDYRDLLLRLRPKLVEILESGEEGAPATFRQAVARAEGAQPNLMLSIGKDLYNRVTGNSSDEATVKAFINTCPPFRAIIYALLMSWYDTSLADWVSSERFRAGRNDLFMSAHLPYCDRFVTSDKAQEKCLREIAAVAALETEILSYDKFCASFLIAA